MPSHVLKFTLGHGGEEGITLDGNPLAVRRLVILAAGQHERLVRLDIYTRVEGEIQIDRENLRTNEFKLGSPQDQEPLRIEDNARAVAEN